MEGPLDILLAHAPPADTSLDALHRGGHLVPRGAHLERPAHVPQQRILEPAERREHAHGEQLALWQAERALAGQHAAALVQPLGRGGLHAAEVIARDFPEVQPPEGLGLDGQQYYVIARDPVLIREIRGLGFVPGLVPAGEPIGAMHELTAPLLEAW